MIPFQIPPSGKPCELICDADYTAPTAMAFDSHNRPYLINNRNPKSFDLIHTIQNGEWITCSCLSAIKDIKPPENRDMHANGELVFDDDDCFYATIAGQLVFSTDFGHTFQPYPCPGSLEVRVGHNKLAEPPAICLMTHVEKIPGTEWGKRGTLSVLLPEKVNNGLVLGEPIHITDNCMAAGSGGHSGGTSFAVTIGHHTHLVYSTSHPLIGLSSTTPVVANHTHVVYSESPETMALNMTGNYIYIATIDRSTRSVIARQFLVNAPPQMPDVHTHPAITVDSRGYMHVLSGSHNEPFFYLQSLKPDDITGGWTKPVKLTGRQTYASIVCDEQDRLHSVFREWIPLASLRYSSAPAKFWPLLFDRVRVTELSIWNRVVSPWSKPRTLVHGADPKCEKKYGIFYHRLFINRASTLYLSFTYWEKCTEETGNYPEALVVSKDGGKSWHLATTETFVQKQKRIRIKKR